MTKLFTRRIVLASSGVVAAGLIGAGTLSWSANASRSQPATVEASVRPARVTTIAFKPQSQSLMLAGTVAPRIESTLGFR
ncbi:MAG: hypothetical protein NTV97_17145, partial [Alphaproteobacteria bacterium]|nr:hypothetical protein [Alphaproteobacteria bacterium]